MTVAAVTMHGKAETPRLAWGICFVLVAALHLIAIWVALHWARPADPLPASPLSVVMINLAPLPEASASAPALPPPPLPPQTHQPPAPAPQVAIPLPPQTPPRPPQPHKPLKRPLKPASITPPAPAAAAPPAPIPAAPSAAPPSPPSPNAVPNWETQLMLRLERFKEYPLQAQFDHQEGVVYLRFTMNRQGIILAASIAKSSGFAALDTETLALIRRAQPLPPPPAAMPGDPVELTVPVRFFLQ